MALRFFEVKFLKQIFSKLLFELVSRILRHDIFKLEINIILASPQIRKLFPLSVLYHELVYN